MRLSQFFLHVWVVAFGFCALGWPNNSHGHQSAKANVSAQSATSSGVQPPRAIERIVVWGFRVRPELFDKRRPPLNAGYAAAVAKADCQTAICAFVVFHDGADWRVTSVLSGPEERLLEMRAQMQGDNTTFVMVHPPANRLKPPYF
jgi:hypothetical protein